MNVSSVTYSEVPQAYRNFHFSGETFTCKSALRPTQVSELGDTMKWMMNAFVLQLQVLFEEQKFLWYVKELFLTLNLVITEFLVN